MHHILYGAFDTFFRPCGAKRSGIERVVRLHLQPNRLSSGSCCMMLAFLRWLHHTAGLTTWLCDASSILVSDLGPHHEANQLARIVFMFI